MAPADTCLSNESVRLPGALGSKAATVLVMALVIALTGACPNSAHSGCSTRKSGTPIESCADTPMHRAAHRRTERAREPAAYLHLIIRPSTGSFNIPNPRLPRNTRLLKIKGA